jgi:hypothetical protein
MSAAIKNKRQINSVQDVDLLDRVEKAGYGITEAIRLGFEKLLGEGVQTVTNTKKKLRTSS